MVGCVTPAAGTGSPSLDQVFFVGRANIANVGATNKLFQQLFWSGALRRVCRGLPASSPQQPTNLARQPCLRAGVVAAQRDVRSPRRRLELLPLSIAGNAGGSRFDEPGRARPRSRPGWQ